MRIATVALIAVLALAGCQKKAVNEVDQEALDQIAIQVETDLNAPGTAILAVLRKAADQSQVGGDALQIGIEGVNYPIDWWLYRHGYVQLYGQLSIGRPALGVTQKARDEFAKGDAA